MVNYMNLLMFEGGPKGCPEISVRNDRYELSNNAEERWFCRLKHAE
jgi:hypothetical protein